MKYVLDVLQPILQCRQGLQCKHAAQRQLNSLTLSGWLCSSQVPGHRLNSRSKVGVAQRVSSEAAFRAQREDLGEEVNRQVWSGAALPHPLKQWVVPACGNCFPLCSTIPAHQQTWTVK